MTQQKNKTIKNKTKIDKNIIIILRWQGEDCFVFIYLYMGLIYFQIFAEGFHRLVVVMEQP
jgi:hypothetical protein